jgi:hypothetical protein
MMNPEDVETVKEYWNREFGSKYEFIEFNP